MALVRCEAAKVMASQREAGDSIKHRGRELNAKADPSSKQGLQANLGALAYLLTCLLAYLLAHLLTCLLTCLLTFLLA